MISMNANQFTVNRVNHEIHKFQRYYAEERFHTGARRQIEIAFKRLKSLFGYNEMPARKEEKIKTWFYGKLLLAALCETLVNNGRFSPSGGRSAKRRKARS